jgi:sortase (surface protein transpeptidase)
MADKTKERLILISNSYLAIGIFLVFLGTAIIIIAKYPQVWYSLNINSPENEFSILTEPLDTQTQEYQEKKEDKKDEWGKLDPSLPPVDFSLPITNYLKIEKVGIETDVLEGEDYEKILENGIWRVNDFGTPEDNNAIILVAHRFGYFNWTQEQRDVHSFFNLPNTRVGDRIEIVWNQRKYIYEIYKLEENTIITDYDADLILYTCKLYNSPVRIFRYAERVN